jgi:hypothetical protein
LESFSYELQFDMHFYMHSYLHKIFILAKSGCYSSPSDGLVKRESEIRCNPTICTRDIGKRNAAILFILI